MNLSLGTGDLTSRESHRAALAEYIATLLFVFIGAGTVVTTEIVAGDAMTPARLTAIAVANGLAIAVLVAAIARFSGGHINPAVTIAAAVTGKISITRGGMYIFMQVAGAISGAFLLKAVIPDAQEGMLGAHVLGAVENEAMGYLVEVILTFFLVMVIFAVAIDPRGPGLPLAPFAIGMVVMVDQLMGIPLTGASMNPARTIGPALAAGEWGAHWVYWLGPITGGVLAAAVYQGIFKRWAGESD